MTCIIGIVEDDVIYLGGDSAEVGGEAMTICSRSDEKVFIVDGEEFAMGFCGSFRGGQLLRYAFDPPEQSKHKSDMAYMVTDFVDAVRAMQKDRGFLKRENEIEEHDCVFIVGYRSKLYVVDSDFQVGCPLGNFTAVGSGSQVALGALYATVDSDKTPEERITLALEAAAEFNIGVRKPFHIVKLEPQAEEQ